MFLYFAISPNLWKLDNYPYCIIMLIVKNCRIILININYFVIDIFFKKILYAVRLGHAFCNWYNLNF